MKLHAYLVTNTANICGDFTILDTGDIAGREREEKREDTALKSFVPAGNIWLL